MPIGGRCPGFVNSRTITEAAADGSANLPFLVTTNPETFEDLSNHPNPLFEPTFCTQKARKEREIQDRPRTTHLGKMSGPEFSLELLVSLLILVAPPYEKGRKKELSRANKITFGLKLMNVT